MLCSYSFADEGALLRQLNALSAPVEVVESDMFWDGGTIFVRLKGAKGREVVYCMDGRMMSSDQGAVFADCTHPSRGGIKVAAGGAVERKLISMLKEWLGRTTEGDDYNVRMVRAFIEQVSKHSADVLSASKKGEFTKKEAIKEAKLLFHRFLGDDKYDKIEVEEEQDIYRVTFIGVPFEEDGRRYKSDMQAVISKATRRMVTFASVGVREVE